MARAMPLARRDLAEENVPVGITYRTSPGAELDRRGMKVMSPGIPLGRSRSLGSYQGCPILIDWHEHVAELRHDPRLGTFPRRVRAVEKVLSLDLQGLEIFTPRCEGYISWIPDAAGHVFHFPPNASPKHMPLNLSTLLSGEYPIISRPSSEEILSIANKLSKTVFGLHCIGWVHGNILSENIIFFWQETEDGHFCDLANPYLVGFDVATLYQATRSSEIPAFHVKSNLYVHPGRRQGLGERSEPADDVYALGIVLLEIALWRPATQLPFSVEMGFLSAVLDIDISIFGKKYTSAVLACLAGYCHPSWDQNRGFTDQQKLAYLLFFSTEILDKISEVSIQRSDSILDPLVSENPLLRKGDETGKEGEKEEDFSEGLWRRRPDPESEGRIRETWDGTEVSWEPGRRIKRIASSSHHYTLASSSSKTKNGTPYVQQHLRTKIYVISLFFPSFIANIRTTNHMTRNSKSQYSQTDH